MRLFVGEPNAPSDAELDAAKAEMKRLLTLLVNSGGSDLHLRVGRAPILRKDGQLVPEDSPVIEEPQIRAMLRSTMRPEE